MSVDFDTVRAAIEYQLELLLTAIREIIYKDAEKVNLAVELPAANDMIDRIRILKVAQINIAQTGVIPSPNETTLNVVGNAIDAYHGHVASRQIGDNKSAELATILKAKSDLVELGN